MACEQNWYQTMEKKERWEGTRDANATAPKSETDLRHTEPSDLEEDDLDELDGILSWCFLLRLLVTKDADRLARRVLGYQDR